MKRVGRSVIRSPGVAATGVALLVACGDDFDCFDPSNPACVVERCGDDFEVCAGVPLGG